MRRCRPPARGFFGTFSPPNEQSFVTQATPVHSVSYAHERASISRCSRITAFPPVAQWDAGEIGINPAPNDYHASRNRIFQAGPFIGCPYALYIAPLALLSVRSTQGDRP